MKKEQEWFKRRSCERKIRYTTRSEALLVRSYMSERLKVYPCKFCGGFHIGKPNKRPAKGYKYTDDIPNRFMFDEEEE